MRSLANEYGVNPGAVVVAWLRALERFEGYPCVIPLFSARAAHLEQNLRGLDLKLDDSVIELMNKTR